MTKIMNFTLLYTYFWLSITIFFLNIAISNIDFGQNSPSIESQLFDIYSPLPLLQAIILFTPAAIRLNSLIALFSKCLRIRRLFDLNRLKGKNTRSCTVLLVSWKCFATALFSLWFSMSPLCPPQPSPWLHSRGYSRTDKHLETHVIGRHGLTGDPDIGSFLIFSLSFLVP